MSATWAIGAGRAEYKQNGAVRIRGVLSAGAVALFVAELEHLVARYKHIQRIGANAVFVREGSSLFLEFFSRDMPFFATLLKQSPVASVVG